MRALTVVSLILAAAAVTPAAASAEVRSGQIGDPREAPDVLSGPRQTDIEQVRVSYDSAGTISVSVTLYEPYGQTVGYGTFGVSLGTASSGDARSCAWYSSGGASITGSLATVPSTPTSDPASSPVVSGTLSISGLDGTLPAPRTVSADGRTTTWTVGTPKLAGRGDTCSGGGSLSSYDRDGHCSPSLSNCQRISYVYTGDTTAEFFFDGYGPPACDNGRDDDGDTLSDLKDPGCAGDKTGTVETDPPPEPPTSEITALRSVPRRGGRCALNVEVEVLPDFRPADLYPFNRVKVTVQGLGARSGYRKTRKLNLGNDLGYSFAVRARGRYRVKLSYPGDKFRLPSNAPSRTVTACPRRRR